MNLTRLREILSETTQEYRKGPEVIQEEKELATGVSLKTTHVYAMPHQAQANWGPDYHAVDCHFITVGVDMPKARKAMPELLDILADYPQPERLAGGPSYIELGAEIGSQEDALRLYALGEALGLWQIITPERMGITGEAADQLAGSGMIMIAGYTPPTT